MSDELIMPAPLFADEAMEVRAPLCRGCGW
jgi:hypothetical protein